MASKKISELTAATAAADTDQFAVNQGGTSKRITRDLVMARKVTGTLASPTLLTDAGLTITAAKLNEFVLVASDGGAVACIGEPQISVGTVIGQRLTLRGTSDTDTYTFHDGDGLNLNGSCVLRNGSMLELIWDGAAWSEVSRNDK